MAVGLLEPSEMPRIPGTRVPESFYLVTREPAPLAGMEYPRWEGLSWSALARLRLVHVVCLTDEACVYDPSPLRSPICIHLQDLASGVPPTDATAEEQLVRKAVAEVLSRLWAGEGAVVHCEGGTGRTGVVLGCVLRALEYTADEVLAYLDRIAKARGRGEWPESDWQADVVRRYVT